MGLARAGPGAGAAGAGGRSRGGLPAPSSAGGLYAGTWPSPARPPARPPVGGRPSSSSAWPFGDRFVLACGRRDAAAVVAAPPWLPRGHCSGRRSGLGLAIVVFRRARGPAGAGLPRCALDWPVRPSSRRCWRLCSSARAWEYARRSTRSAGDDRPPRIYDFSVEPYRLAEAVWPHVFGVEVPENASWIQALPPRASGWSGLLRSTSGGFTLVLALGGAGFRGGRGWRRWLTILACRPGRRDRQVRRPALVGSADPGIGRLLGPHDPPAGLPRPTPSCPTARAASTACWRRSSPASRCSATRPSCWSSPACAAALAGLGWDRLCRGESPSGRTRRRCLTGFRRRSGRRWRS